MLQISSEKSKKWGWGVLAKLQLCQAEGKSTVSVPRGADNCPMDDIRVENMRGVCVGDTSEILSRKRERACERKLWI